MKFDIDKILGIAKNKYNATEIKCLGCGKTIYTNDDSIKYCFMCEQKKN